MSDKTMGQIIAPLAGADSSINCETSDSKRSYT